MISFASKVKFHIILFGLFSLSHLAISQSYFKEIYPEVWQRSVAYTIAVAVAMPDSLYDYRPEESVLSFRRQIAHIIDNFDYLTYQLTGKKQGWIEKGNIDKMNKNELVNKLENAGVFIYRLIASYDEGKLQEDLVFGGQSTNHENIFYLIRNHMTHHRAQCILNLRMNGIDAPRYVGW